MRPTEASAAATRRTSSQAPSTERLGPHRADRRASGRRPRPARPAPRRGKRGLAVEGRGARGDLGQGLVQQGAEGEVERPAARPGRAGRSRAASPAAADSGTGRRPRRSRQLEQRRGQRARSRRSRRGARPGRARRASGPRCRRRGRRPRSAASICSALSPRQSWLSKLQFQSSSPCSAATRAVAAVTTPQGARQAVGRTPSESSTARPVGDLGPHLLPRSSSLVADVAKAVEADLVPALAHRRDQLGLRQRPAGVDEEGRRRPVALQLGEDARGPDRIGPVVEGERDRAGETRVLARASTPVSRRVIRRPRRPGPRPRPAPGSRRGRCSGAAPGSAAPTRPAPGRASSPAFSLSLPRIAQWPTSPASAMIRNSKPSSSSESSPR